MTYAMPQQGLYEGTWFEDQKEGFGRERYADKSVYVGHWR